MRPTRPARRRHHAFHRRRRPRRLRARRRRRPAAVAASDVLVHRRADLGRRALVAAAAAAAGHAAAGRRVADTARRHPAAVGVGDAATAAVRQAFVARQILAARLGAAGCALGAALAGRIADQGRVAVIVDQALHAQAPGRLGVAAPQRRAAVAVARAAGASAHADAVGDPRARLSRRAAVARRIPAARDAEVAATADQAGVGGATRAVATRAGGNRRCRDRGGTAAGWRSTS